MARILLADPDENHAQTVVSLLERNGHRITLCPSKGEVFQHLQKAKPTQFKIVIWDFANRPEDWKFLTALSRLMVTEVYAPRILCLARTNWGPTVKLQVERKGARL